MTFFCGDVAVLATTQIHTYTAAVADPRELMKRAMREWTYLIRGTVGELPMQCAPSAAIPLQLVDG